VERVKADGGQILVGGRRVDPTDLDPSVAKARVCLFVCLFCVCVCVCLSVCLSVYLPVCLSLCLYLCLCLYVCASHAAG
jgi:hypothetical protein